MATDKNILGRTYIGWNPYVWYKLKYLKINILFILN